MGAALRLNLAVDCIIRQKRERVSVRVFEAGRDRAPGLRLRRMVKSDAATVPFLEFRKDIFGLEDDLSRTADECAFLGTGFRSDERKHGGAIGRSDSERTACGLQGRVRDQAESQLIQVESPASLLVANENRNRAETQIGIIAIRLKLKTGPERKHWRRVSGSHRGKYSSGATVRAFAANVGELRMDWFYGTRWTIGWMTHSAASRARVNTESAI